MDGVGTARRVHRARGFRLVRFRIGNCLLRLGKRADLFEVWAIAAIWLNPFAAYFHIDFERFEAETRFRTGGPLALLSFAACRFRCSKLFANTRHKTCLQFDRTETELLTARRTREGLTLIQVGQFTPTQRRAHCALDFNPPHGGKTTQPFRERCLSHHAKVIAIRHALAGQSFRLPKLHLRSDLPYGRSDFNRYEFI
jgi:hypothetical protein